MNSSKAPKQRLLAALFTKGAKLGLDADTIRNQITPEVLKKRLSEAEPREIVRVIEHMTGLYKSRPKKYESSKAGLIEELEDAAKARWGASFEHSLNAFINSHAFQGTKTHYKFMRVTDLKAFKDRLVQLNRAEHIIL